jgi:4-amino-4-deoxy-L-arabinose transferase-like glycosyltransferase
MKKPALRAEPIPDVSNRAFAGILVAILLLQFAAGLWHIGFPFIDGRLHYNWNAPFWLIHAKATNEVGLVASAFGVEGYHSHPQLIGPVTALWTRVAGYSEASARTLSLLISILATLFLGLAGRQFFGNRRGVALAAFYASLPMIYIYGRMLNQEVLVSLFLAIQLWGFSLVDTREKAGLALITIGSLGMTLSDWSGFVFAGLLGLATLLVWKWSEHKYHLIKIMAYSWAAAALGLVIFFVQDKLQSGPTTSGSMITNGFYQLWQYRAGLTEEFSWLSWLVHQIAYFSVNYSIPLILTAIGVLIAVGLKKILRADRRIWVASVFALSVLAGQLFYNFVVPQASSIHLYFQYFFSIPVAFGMVFISEFVAETLLVENKMKAFAVVSGILLIATGAYACYQYDQLLFHSSGVDVTDIELIKSLNDIPASSSVIAVNNDEASNFWYGNPNIDYYAGRTIKAYLVDQGFPYADFIIVPSVYSDQFLKQINEEHGFGRSVSAKSDRCSKNLCVLDLTE